MYITVTLEISFTSSGKTCCSDVPVHFRHLQLHSINNMPLNREQSTRISSTELAMIHMIRLIASFGVIQSLITFRLTLLLSKIVSRSRGEDT